MAKDSTRTSAGEQRAAVAQSGLKSLNAPLAASAIAGAVRRMATAAEAASDA